jgi:anti-sigma regulatory factor (Ser/Thr protein kinase)
VRAALRAYAVQDQAPGEVLTHADELVRGLADDVLVTCVYAVLDPRDGTLAIANAGHVPPLVLGGAPPDGKVRRRALTATGPPLGAGGREPYGERFVSLAQDQLLALFTDGLVESRDADIGAGLRGLAARLDPAAPDLDAVCDAVTGTADRNDDVALLLVRGDAATQPPLARLEVDAAPGEVRRARVFARDTLRAWQEPEGLADAAQLAVSELVTNAVRYGAAPLIVQLSRHDDGIVVEVADDGAGTPRRRWLRPYDDAGRGLVVVAGVAAAWGARSRGKGKVVWCRLSRPASEGARR